VKAVDKRSSIGSSPWSTGPGSEGRVNHPVQRERRLEVRKVRGGGRVYFVDGDERREKIRSFLTSPAVLSLLPRRLAEVFKSAVNGASVRDQAAVEDRAVNPGSSKSTVHRQIKEALAALNQARKKGRLSAPTDLLPREETAI
jgi:hypothetical protein